MESTLNISNVYVFWTRGREFVSRRIRSVDYTIWHGKRLKSAINHVGLRFVFDNGWSVVSESHFGPGVQIVPYEHVRRAIKENKVEWYHEKLLSLTTSEKNDVWRRAEAATGSPYGVVFILRYWAATRLFGKRRKIIGPSYVRKTEKTCNTHVVSVVHPYVIEINEDAYYWTPEALFQLWVGEPSEIVYRREIGGRKNV